MRHSSEATRQYPDLPQIDGVQLRHIDGWVGYAVGDDGSVWSCLKTGPSKCFAGWRRLKPTNQRGRLAVDLSNGKKKLKRSVHTLVLEAFVGPRPDGCVARHVVTNDATNNCLWNLQWGTSSENEADKVRHGTKIVGEAMHNAKVTAADVVEMRRLSSLGMTFVEIGRSYNISATQVSNIVSKKQWSHI